LTSRWYNHLHRFSSLERGGQPEDACVPDADDGSADEYEEEEDEGSSDVFIDDNDPSDEEEMSEEENREGGKEGGEEGLMPNPNLVKLVDDALGLSGTSSPKSKKIHKEAKLLGISPLDLMRQELRKDTLELLHRIEVATKYRFEFKDAFAAKRQGGLNTISESAIKDNIGLFDAVRGFLIGVAERHIVRKLQCPDIGPANALILSRAIDGLPTNLMSMQSLCKIAYETYGIRLLILWQFNKVFETIRPYRMHDFKGLGGVADIEASWLLRWIKRERGFDDAQAERLAAVWEIIAETKGGTNKNAGGGRGIQDRNRIPPLSILKAEESTWTASFGKNCQRRGGVR
jgi:hypothetical protein